MKMTPLVPTAPLPVIKANTNASPERFAEEAQSATPAPVVPVEGVVEATKPLDPQAAEFAKRRRALQIKEKELADRERALQDTSVKADPVDFKAQLKSDPLRVLQEAGVTYDQLTQAILDSQGNSEVRALKAEIEALKEGVNKNFTDRDTLQEQQVLAEMRKEAVLLSKTGEDFELVRETNSIPDVMKLIERTYRENGEVLDVREALQLYEDELVKDSLKLAGTNKLKSRLAPSPVPQKSQGQMRTLTNKDTASNVMSAKARAIAAFNGTLRK
jgi:hypothetical protein